MVRLYYNFALNKKSPRERGHGALIRTYSLFGVIWSIKSLMCLQ